MQQFLYQQLPDLDHTELDVYMIEHLQNQITQSSPGIEPKHGMLLEVSNRIHELIKTHLSGKTSLSQWAQRFSDLLSEIYASHQLKPHHPEDAILIEPLTHIARVLREWFTVSSAVDQLAGCIFTLTAPLTIFALRPHQVTSEGDSPKFHPR